MCVTLIIYQESLHDARSTKYKKNDIRTELLKPLSTVANRCTIHRDTKSLCAFPNTVYSCVSFGYVNSDSIPKKHDPNGICNECRVFTVRYELNMDIN